MKPNAIKAQKHWERAKEMVSKRKSPFAGMSEQDVIDKIRKDREKIWEEKFAPRS